MRKNIFKNPTKKASKAKTIVKPKVEDKVEPKVRVEKRTFGKKPWSELSPIEKRMLDLYGSKYGKK